MQRKETSIQELWDTSDKWKFGDTQKSTRGSSPLFKVSSFVWNESKKIFKEEKLQMMAQLDYMLGLFINNS